LKEMKVYLIDTKYQIYLSQTSIFIESFMHQWVIYFTVWSVKKAYDEGLWPFGLRSRIKKEEYLLIDHSKV
jgi:hypothetical protein